MKIKFEEGRENGYLEYFAISQGEVWKRKVYDELMWAEIKVLPNSAHSFTEGSDEQMVEIRWEDDWSNPIKGYTLEQAKTYIEDNWQKHRPHVNGVSYDIDET